MPYGEPKTNHENIIQKNIARGILYCKTIIPVYACIAFRVVRCHLKVTFRCQEIFAIKSVNTAKNKITANITSFTVLSKRKQFKKI